MKIINSLFCFVSMLFFFCSFPNEKSENVIHVSPVTSINNVIVRQENITFNIRARWPNSGGNYSHSEINKLDSYYYIKIYGYEPSDAVCLPVLSSFECIVNIGIENSGKYHFSFWQSDTSSLDTTINVP
jgi:hypothetical protein